MAGERYVIIANGHWPEEAIWRPLVEGSDHVMACDGAAVQCIEHNVTMNSIIGDMDSLPVEIESKLKQEEEIQFLEQSIQEENDLVKALHWAIKQGASRIEVFGIEGGDMSHQFAAFLALCEVPFHTRLNTSQGTIELIQKSGYKNCSIEKKRLFSLFAIGAVEGIKTSGAKWNLKNERLRPGTRGLHNQVEGECLEISMDSGQLLLFLNR